MEKRTRGKQSPEHVEKRISKIRGENHGRWKGGLQRRPYRNLIEKKECARCSATERLGIHHKDGDHYNNVVENLEVLCASCHMREHKKAFWAAKREGRESPKGNGPVGWKFEPKGRGPTKKSAVAAALGRRGADLTRKLPDGTCKEIADELGMTLGAVYAQAFLVRRERQ